MLQIKRAEALRRFARLSCRRDFLPTGKMERSMFNAFCPAPKMETRSAHKPFWLPK